MISSVHATVQFVYLSLWHLFQWHEQPSPQHIHLCDKKDRHRTTLAMHYTFEKQVVDKLRAQVDTLAFFTLLQLLPPGRKHLQLKHVLDIQTYTSTSTKNQLLLTNRRMQSFLICEPCLILKKQNVMNKANLHVPEINFVLNTVQTRKQHLIGPIQIYSTDTVTKISSLLKHIFEHKTRCIL